ncbi:MAG: UDP-2,4-diacetamido-2,4,6-trideoxy-beta-L-altropyranose hydrolase [Pseudomonadales bacterium]
MFRVDASPEVGLGHIMRCLTLAQALKASGDRCYFVCQPGSGLPERLLSEHGFEFIILDDERSRGDKATDPFWLNEAQDANNTGNKIQTITGGIGWLIVDHYGLGAQWHEQLRSAVGRIMVIDDLANRAYHCDALLDQTEGRKPEDYSQFVPSSCELLLGAKFALLRNQFAEKRAPSIERRRSIERVERIFVSMGGADSENLTGLVLEAINQCKLGYTLEIDVVVGTPSEHLPALQAQAQMSIHRVYLHTDVSDMAGLMVSADLAIGAAGISAWERCCLGMPALIIVADANQAVIAETLEQRGAATIVPTVKPDLIRVALKALLLDPLRLKQLSTVAQTVCDGNGARIVADRLHAMNQ